MWPWAGPALVAAHPGAVVVTVAAGKPTPHPLSDWDGKCGFAEGDDVIGMRRKEDEEALKHLGAQALWLEFLDRQYMGGVPPSRVEVPQAIESVVKATAPVLVASPLGLGHPTTWLRPPHAATWPDGCRMSRGSLVRTSSTARPAARPSMRS